MSPVSASAGGDSVPPAHPARAIAATATIAVRLSFLIAFPFLGRWCQREPNTLWCRGSRDPELPREHHRGRAACDDVVSERCHPHRQLPVEFGHRASTEGVDGGREERSVE